MALLFGATWVLVGVFGAVILRWEKTRVTEARMRELEEEREAAERVSVGIRVWRVIVTAVLVGIPLLFAIDGLVFPLGILYAPSLTFSLGPDLALQIAGIVLSAAGLAVLIGLGRKLAVNVYRLAVHERELMTSGFHRYVRHPFYVHFLLIPVGSFPPEPELFLAAPLRRLHDAMGAEAVDGVDARGGGGPATSLRGRGGGIPATDWPVIPRLRRPTQDA